MKIEISDRQLDVILAVLHTADDEMVEQGLGLKMRDVEGIIAKLEKARKGAK